VGLNGENSRRLVFDIETVPLVDAAEYLEEPEAPSNYSKPDAIAKYVEKAKAEQLAKCSLDVDLCRIVAMGWQIEGDRQPSTALVADADESLMLRRFWREVGDHHLVGFNCLGFDLPVLLRRSLYLGVEAPSIQIDRFKHPKVTDLMDELSYGGKLKLRGLAFYCKRFGIDVPDPLTGADIAQAVEEGRWQDVEHHVTADIQKTAALASRLGYFASESF
jgi:predicted PolB exonuclease-like 3'-5' exonuclease